uniref:Uncharacterized protein n=1 Tax=Anguilla anguilla TaxID=7936 RepID=A0A0E9Q6M5_ANGAN
MAKQTGTHSRERERDRKGENGQKRRRNDSQYPPL